MPGKRKPKVKEVPESEEPGDEREATSAKKRKAASGAAASSGTSLDPEVLKELEEADDDDEDEEEEVQEGDEEEEEEGSEQLQIWRPGIDEVKEGEQLDVEPGTYDMLHRAQVEWPCLSFDVMRDALGAQRTTYPMTAYVVTGSQAARAEDNRIYVMKWSKLYKTAKDGREDEDDDDEDEEEEEEDDEHEALLESKGVPHPGGVNRVRSMTQAPHIVATWADTGKVHIWNLEAQRKALDTAGKALGAPKPIFTCQEHKEEGFAMDFSPHETGKLLSGSNDGHVLLWEPVQGGWKVDSSNPFKGHQGSVEDVQWKRQGTGTKSLFASCGVDRSFRVWDVREPSRTKAALQVLHAHGGDVNVLSWSPLVGELLATGSDDGGFKVWDTRKVDAGAMANFQWHQKPVTSLDWHPTDDTVLAVSSEDDCLSIWDLAVEDDAAGGQLPPGAEHFPPQLLFVHQGQSDLKELRWHPQLPGVCISTSGSGFNIFKTCNS